MPLVEKLTKYTTASPIIASFSFTDIADGSGVQVFFGSNSKADTTNSYELSKVTLFSNDVNTQAATTGVSPTFALTLDIDFDINFNLAQQVKGIIKGNIAIGGRTTSAAPNAWSAYAIIKLRKWDGVTETEIANVQTETISKGGGAINVKESKVLNFAIDASSAQTHFAAGETLRVTVEIWSHDNGGSNTGFGHDPKGRTDTTAVLGGIIEDADSTILQINIPFLIPL